MVVCATDDMSVNYQARTERSRCAGDGIPGVHMLTVSLLKARAIETEQLLHLLLNQNIGLYMRVWRDFRSKEEDKEQFFTFAVDD